MRWVPLLLLSVAACATPGAQTRQALTEQPQPITGAALDFTLKRWPDGATYQLASDRGSVVLLDVWATWCEPCRDSLPLYINLEKTLSAQGLKVVTLNVDEDERMIEPFVRDLKLGLPVLLDPGGRLVEERLHVRVMPTSLLIDRRGVVRAIEEGFAGEILPKYLKQLSELLEEKP